MAGAHEVRDAVGDDAGLAGPRAGEDEQRAVHLQHGLALLGVQFVKEVHQEVLIILRGAMVSEMPHEPERPCPICGGQSRYRFTSKHDRRIFECSNRECGHFFTPALSEADGIVVREADLERQSAESLAAWDERNTRLLACLMREVPDPSRRLAFLDFGAGDAHVSRTFKRLLGERVTIYCLDANPACRGLYRQHGLVEVGSLDAVPEKIDVVYMIEVIEHLENPIASLRAAAPGPGCPRDPLPLHPGRIVAAWLRRTPTTAAGTSTSSRRDRWGLALEAAGFREDTLPAPSGDVRVAAGGAAPGACSTA